MQSRMAESSRHGAPKSSRRPRTNDSGLKSSGAYLKSSSPQTGISREQHQGSILLAQSVSTAASAIIHPTKINPAANNESSLYFKCLRPPPHSLQQLSAIIMIKVGRIGVSDKGGGGGDTKFSRHCVAY